jgi:hypothetical protein
VTGQPEHDPGGDVVAPEDDHDLLTLTSASDRLTEAIREEEVHLAEIEGVGDEARVARSRDRLAALRVARERHRRAPITAVNAAEFYGSGAEDAEESAGG